MEREDKQAQQDEAKGGDREVRQREERVWLNKASQGG